MFILPVKWENIFGWFRGKWSLFSAPNHLLNGVVDKIMFEFSLHPIPHNEHSFDLNFFIDRNTRFLYFWWHFHCIQIDWKKFLFLPESCLNQALANFAAKNIRWGNCSSRHRGSLVQCLDWNTAIAWFLPRWQPPAARHGCHSNSNYCLLPIQNYHTCKLDFTMILRKRVDKDWCWIVFNEYFRCPRSVLQ